MRRSLRPHPVQSRIPESSQRRALSTKLTLHKVQEPTDDLALAQELQVCPEEVSRVEGYPAHKLCVAQLAQLLPRQVPVRGIGVLKPEVVAGPLEPPEHLVGLPQRRVWAGNETTLKLPLARS